jgi:hypothetical protein
MVVIRAEHFQVGQAVAGLDLVLDDAHRDVSGQHRVGDLVERDPGLSGAPEALDLGQVGPVP